MSEPNFLPLSIAVLTVSDSRTEATDKSGALLAERLQAAGHKLADKAIEIDDVYRLRAKLSVWIADPQIHVVIATGGTGITGRDVTPEALQPLFDRPIDGFGELFRQLSFEEIGAATMQSRAVAGIANGTLIFCLPGSSGACATGWDRILATQLDRRTRPCNFAQLIERFSEK
ncbi:MAG: molybdenum cofactor biosynthesis protein B [Salinisphaeraceae bacterium]|nr:molybdenum cofactor biosynthesis protein B [Salinisphaeraceae bacterium]